MIGKPGRYVNRPSSEMRYRRQRGGGGWLGCINYGYVCDRSATEVYGMCPHPTVHLACQTPLELNAGVLGTF